MVLFSKNDWLNAMASAQKPANYSPPATNDAKLKQQSSKSNNKSSN